MRNLTDKKNKNKFGGNKFGGNKFPFFFKALGLVMLMFAAFVYDALGKLRS